MEQKPAQGGFVQTSPYEGSPGKEVLRFDQKSAHSQGLRPVTLKQILNANSVIPDGPLMVDGKELSQVSFVGRVNKVTVSPSNIQYVIDDGTGTVDVRQYTDMEEDDSRPTFGEGCYVRVVGQVKRFNAKKSVTVYKIFQIESLDELAHHFLSTVVTHLGLTKPRPVSVLEID
jgi:replication factor A2